MKLTEELEYGIKELKKAILNPLYIFSTIIGLELPDDNLPYTSTLYTTLDDLFDALFIMDIFGPKVDKILDKYNIDEKKLNNIIQNKNKINMYTNLFHIIEDDIKELHKEVCKSLLYGTNADVIIENLYRLLSNITIDEFSIYSEVKANVVYKSEKHISSIVKLINRLITNILDSLIPKTERNDNMKRNHSKNVTTEWKKDEHGNTYFDISKKDKVKVNNSKKKQDEKELRMFVNNIDKENGCNLKHPKEMIDDSFEYHIQVENLKMILSRMLLILSDVNPENYTIYNSIFGEEVRKIKINKAFKEESRWFNDISYDIKDMRFKIRFLCYMIVYIIKNLDIIANVCYKANNDSRFTEYEMKMEYVNYTVERLCDLVCKMLKGISYDDDLVYFTEIQIYLESSKKNIKKNMTKIENIHEQSEILSHRLRIFSREKQDVSMDTLLKLSYLVSTSDHKAKDIIDFNEGYKFHKRKETKKMIEELGYAILSSREDYTIPKIFEFFIKSDPLLYSKWKDVNENKELLVGMVSLYYYAFIINDKRIVKRINKLLS